LKVLILATDYPSIKNKATLHYIHVRNVYYAKKGVNVVVLNFSATKNYSIDEINVITLDTYKKEMEDEKFDILLCHAPNIRNHYKFLKQYEIKFPKLVFFFHGHEVLKIKKVYPKPYYYVKNRNIIKGIIQDMYDQFKLAAWRKYYSKLAEKSHFVFVSKWMYDEFIKWTRIDKNIIEDKYSITYNAIDYLYELNDYSVSNTKKYDFITIRSILDGSKYCIDLVCDLANHNPKYEFLIVGKGEFFKYYNKPKNITWIDDHFKHNQIIEVLNQAHCALMPTRTDAQGLMVCEMASFGIPIITSDIPVCHEVFENFENIAFINNENNKIDLTSLLNELKSRAPYKKNKKYFNNNTSSNELKLFNYLTSKI
jgi:glycosyltransferase involved in cell wall biosynthesis